MVVGLAAALAANGQQDSTNQFYGRGYGNSPMAGQNGDSRVSEEEPISIKGKLTLEDGKLPYIENNGVQYILMVPGNDYSGLDIKDGMTISVEGIEMPGYGRAIQWSDSEKALMVTSAVINGEEITIDHPLDGSGFRSGMAGNFGGRRGRRS